MRFRIFLTDLLQFPFHSKRLIFITLVCLPAIAFSFTAAAGGQQPTDDTRQLIKQAKKLTRKGEYGEAEKLLRRIIEINPQATNAKLNLAYNLLKQKQLVEAYKFSIEVARAEPKNSYAFAVLGMVLLSAGNFKESQVSFINALQLDKQEALAWAGLGTLNFYENRVNLGLGQLQTAVYYKPSEPDFLFTLAQIAARAEDYKQAAEAYRMFLQISLQTDSERRNRIKGLIKFLEFLGTRQSLYDLSGSAETNVPIRLVNDRPVIQVNVNGSDESLNFVLDTGSGISVISNQTAQKLKIKPVARGGLAHGIGGDGTFEIVYGFLRSAQIGGVQIKNIPVYIREFQSKNEKIDGYIGLSLISKFLTTLDYGNSTFSLKKKDAVSDRQRENEFVSIPLRLTSSGFLSGEVQLEGIGVPLNFIVDTGASISVISSELADSKELSQFVRAEKMRVVGAAGITEEVPSFLLPKVSFGTNSRERVKVVALNLGIINETSGFVQAGILGGNFLKNYRLTFDFTNSKVVFVPIK